MITFLKVDGRNCPAVVCDWCGKRIEKASEGNCEWFEDEQGQPVSGKAVDNRGRRIPGPLFFVHKHCSRPCESASGDLSLSEDLDTFLFNLEHNCSFDRKSAAERSKLSARF